MPSEPVAIEALNKATNIITPSFTTGDFVPTRRAAYLGHNLKFPRFGPFRISTVHFILL